MLRSNAILLAGTVLAGFLMTVILGKALIPFLRKLKFGQTIREIGPAWHKNKQGTPTMGGLMFILGLVIVLPLSIAVCELFSKQTVLSATPATLTRLFAGLVMALCCGAIGFIDDYIKVVKKRNLGLTSRQKLFGQLLIGAGYGVSMYLAGGTLFYIPFIGYVDFGLWLVPFCMLVVVGATNATNLTDGIDGLCASIGLVIALFFMAVSGSFVGQSLSAAALSGTLLGFLVFNLHPAKVFMGDTGSLFIGGMLTALALGIGQPFLLISAGIVYIFETLSVMLQVTYFKLTHGKRLFKMSPFHHHLEMCGMSEMGIVTLFGAVTAVGCGCALLIRA